jgi:protein-L-isoaspartate(D-aspartate) O-methyltransferase
VEDLAARGLLRSERIRQALLKVRREDFIPRPYRDYAYQEVPLPLPGATATISCPHSYPLFYEPLGLGEGHRFLEIGLGSGYGTALVREIVGIRGRVVAVEIDPETLAFARANLEWAGYEDVVLVQGDGGLGCRQLAPYDRICLTAACERVPPPLLAQLHRSGRLIAPIFEGEAQILTVLEKHGTQFRSESICEVLYSNLGGIHGVGAPPMQKLVVTCRNLRGFRRAQVAIERNLPHARVSGAGFQGVVLVEGAGDAEEMAARVTRECVDAIGRATAVVSEVPSEPHALMEAAVQVAANCIAAGESFAVRVHKRRSHGYRQGTHDIEREVGAAIGAALERQYGRAPRVDLTDPDVTIGAEVLGPVTLIGVIRKTWGEHSPAR